MHLSKLSWCSFYQYSEQYSFHDTGCFPTYTVIIIETMDSSERRTNQFLMTTINSWKESLPSQSSKQQPPILKAGISPTEVRQLGSLHIQLFTSFTPYQRTKRVPRGLVVKCLTRNPEALGSSHTGSFRFFRGSVFGQDTSEPSLVLVKPRKA